MTTRWVSNTTGGGGGGGGGPLFGNAVSASPATSQNDYAPAGFSSSTGTLILAAASGDSTITGLSSAGFVNNQLLQICNSSTTDNLIFPNLSGSSSAANQFSNAISGTAVIQPNSCAILTWLSGKWKFSS